MFNFDDVKKFFHAGRNPFLSRAGFDRQLIEAKQEVDILSASQSLFK